MTEYVMRESDEINLKYLIAYSQITREPLYTRRQCKGKIYKHEKVINNINGKCTN